MMSIKVPKHVEHIISAINHSVAYSWVFFSTSYTSVCRLTCKYFKIAEMIFKIRLKLGKNLGSFTRRSSRVFERISSVTCCQFEQNMLRRTKHVSCSPLCVLLCVTVCIFVQLSEPLHHLCVASHV